MKKIIFLFIVCICVLGIGIFLLSKTNTPHVPVVTAQSQLPRPSPVAITYTSLFVPYWTLSGSNTFGNYSQLIYFGITANSTGIDTQENGYKNLDKFIQLATATAKKFLTIRMIDSSVNEQVIQDTGLQEKIISQAISVAQSKHFDGIVLDFEY